MANPKKPTALKILQGTNRKDRAVEQEPEFEQQEIYDPPEELDGLALKTWLSVEPVLREAKVLTVADIRALELYCVAYSNFKRAQEEVEENGYTVAGATGGIIKNPACTVVKEMSAEVRALSGVLGLDPAARTRINVGKKTPAKKTFGAISGSSARNKGA